MNKKLKSAVFYSEDRVSISDLDLENYVTTDNLLQNKQGKTKAVNLPPQDGNVTRFDTEDILIANIRPYLKKIWSAKHPGGNSADVLTLKVNNKYEPKFIYYALHRDVFFEHVMNGSKGTKMPRGDKDQILEFPIPDFEKPVQKKIAKVLSDLDSKIELNNKINEELEAMAKLIYDYWFVQFDFPISKEQAEDLGNPKLEGKPYKSSGGKMVYNEELKREIPEGWDNGTLENIANLVRGVSYTKKDIESEDALNVTPILRATNITGNVIDLDDMVYVSDDFVSEKQLLNKFDVLITMSSGSINHIGKNGFFYFDRKVSLGAFCAKLVGKEELKYYLFSYTQSDFMSETIKNECLGTNINNLNSSLVNSFKVVIPSKKILKNFNKIVEPFYKKIANNHKENHKLTELRDWLLPMLMNGQVTVGQAEAELSKAAEPEVEYKGEQQARILPFVPRVTESEMQVVSADSDTTIHAALISRILVKDKSFDAGERHLGRTLVEKTIHVIESHTKCDVGRMPYRKARGAVDFDRITQKVEPHAKKKKWFISKKIDGKVIYSGGMNDFEGYRKSAEYFRNKIDEIDRIIDLFLPLNTHRGEVCQTTYAAWHDLIAMGYKPKNEDIVTHSSTKEFWHEEKEKIPKEEFFEAIEWLKENDLVPDGKGKMTEKVG